MLTCAHVVNLALGRPAFEPDPPQEHDGIVPGLAVILPGRGPHRLRVAVDRWLPGVRDDRQPARPGDPEWADDLALLRLVDPAPPGPDGPHLGDHRTGPSAFAWFGSGNASTVAPVRVQGVTDRWLVLDTPASSQALVEGYSGSPLWDRDRQRVVGLVVSRRKTRAFAIPVQVITRHFPRLAPIGAPGADGAGARPHAWQHLLDTVRRALPHQADREGVARALAAELAEPLPPDGEPATPERLVLTASAADHGTATLLALLADRAATTADRLDIQAAAVFTAPDELLTAIEHRTLQELLRGHPGSPAAVAATLPSGLVHDDPGWPGLTRRLEGYRPRHGAVPALLDLVEAAADTAPEPLGAALRAWNDRVADRLGVAPALVEGRARAAEARRAARPGTASGPVVQLQLWPAGPPHTYRAVVRTRDAHGTARHLVCLDTPTTRTALMEHLAGFIAASVRESAPGAMPTVEVFVRKDQLDLDVDRWVYRPDEIFPSILGEDFQVVLRCPELRRPEYWPELRYRWQARHTGAVLAQHRREPAVQERGRPEPVSGVALCGPLTLTARLRAIALAVGVPAVAWPRPAAGPEGASHLHGLATGLRAAQLPRAVYEARLGAADGGPGRHLALVYDGPDGLPETLQLGDPQ